MTGRRGPDNPEDEYDAAAEPELADEESARAERDHWHSLEDR